jgi:hypothetical protein
MMEQTQLLSDEAYNLAEQHQLGKPISEFPNLIEAENLRKGRKNIRIGLFLSWLLLSVIFIGLAVLTYFITQPVPYGPEPTDTFFHYFITGFFLFGECLLTAMLIRFASLIRKKSLICSHGILNRQGKREDMTTWEQVTAIHMLSVENRVRSAGKEKALVYQVKRVHRPSFALDAIRGAAAEETYAQERIPALLISYESGTPLVLDKLTLDSTGIRRGNRTLSWQDLSMCKTEQDPPQICLFQRGSDRAWVKLRSQDVPSLVLTRSLIEIIQGKYQTAERLEQ